MDKLVRISITQKDNPHGAFVIVETTLDGVQWKFSCGERMIKYKDHLYDEIPNEYIHMNILYRVKQLVAKGYKLVE